MRFAAAEAPDAVTAHAVLVFGEDLDGVDQGSGRRLLLAARAGSVARREVRFGDSRQLDARLRRRVLWDSTATDSSVPTRAGDEIFATIGDRPIWLRRHEEGAVTDVVAHAPSELADEEVLRDQLEPARFLGLLPLVHFLRELCAAEAWQAPPARAAFVVDDPNLHWATYGHLSYPDLVAEARLHGYHTSIAMIPIDGWYAHGSTVGLFRESPDAVSLSVHGNEHRMHELGRPRTSGEARRILAQALRRTASFERRTGLSVSRVMVPPYEACSAASMAAMLDVGFEAVSLTRPYPWLPVGPEHSSYATPDGAQRLSGWPIAELVADGLPVLIRRQFDEHDEIVLRGYLNQPVILYGHVADFADGLDRLAAAAAIVNSLPSVSWASLADIAATNFEWRRSGSTLEIRPFALRLRLRVEPDVEQIRIVQPEPESRQAPWTAPWTRRSLDGRDAHLAAEEGFVALPADRADAVEVELSCVREVVPESIPPPPFAPQALARRMLVETRDRLDPVLRRGRRLSRDRR